MGINITKNVKQKISDTKEYTLYNYIYKNLKNTDKTNSWDQKSGEWLLLEVGDAVGELDKHFRETTGMLVIFCFLF